MNAESTPASQPRDGNPRIISTIVIALAATLQLVVAVPFTVATGLVAPLWAIVIAWSLWVAAAVVLVMTALGWTA